MTQSLPSTGASGAAGGLTSPDFWEARWKQARDDAAADTEQAINGPEGHVAGEYHHGRFQLVTLGCDMGVPGTTLTQTGIWGHRVIEFPLQANTWKLTASPASGSCVVDVLKAASLDAFHAGTYSSVTDAGRLTISSRREGHGAALGVWPVVDWAVGEVLVWQLLSVSGSIEVLTAQLGMRRT